ncbi:MAG: hypothetical protein ABUL72_03535, partial [Armatimonadota bacterium]
MKLIPSLLVIAAIVLIVPAAEAQSKVGRGKDSDKSKSSSTPVTRSGGSQNRGNDRTPNRQVEARPVRGSDPRVQPVNTSPRPTRTTDSRVQPVNTTRRDDSRRHQGDNNRVQPVTPRPTTPRTESRPTYVTPSPANASFNSFAPTPTPQSKLGRGKGNGGGGGGGSSSGGGGGSSSPKPRSGDGGGSSSSGGGNNGGARSGDSGRTSDSNYDWRNNDQNRQPRRTESRSGRVNYGSRSNNPVSRDQHPVRVSNLPVVTVHGDNDRVRRGSGRQPQAHVNYEYSRDLRRGYWQYNNNWRDNYFRYPHYQFTYTNGCFISPWYYYTNLPGYIDPYRCNSYVSVNFGWGLGVRYGWRNHHTIVYVDNGYNYGSGYVGDTDLDRSVNEIETAFRTRDVRQIDELVPRGGQVSIDLVGQPAYSLGSDDFYDLINDAITATQTTSYSIVDVYRNGDTATIVADHTFVDAWGGNV